MNASLVLASTSDGLLKAFYRVYNELGFGFLESVYRRAMLIELHRLGLAAAEEVALEVLYSGAPVGFFRADLFVEREVVVEIKCANALTAHHDAQLLNYLQASGTQLGFLLNFGPKPTFRRLVHTEKARRWRG